MNKARHTDIARDLTDAITQGRYAVGALLPTEMELCSSYGASRYTVRLALGALQESGLISRRKNVGTRVEAAKPSAGFVQSLASIEDLAQFGAEHVRVVRRIEPVVADLALARQLGCAGGTRWLRISSLRMDGERGVKAGKRGLPGLPIGWTDVYVDPAYDDIGARVRESPQTLVSSLIEQHYGRRIARVRQEISATAVHAALAAELRVEPGSAALQVRRSYFDAAGDVVEITLSVHPHDRFTFATELHRARE